MPLVSNAGDRRQVKEAGKKAKLRRARELEDVRRVLETDAGRRLVWRLLARAGVFEISFKGDATWTFFNEGRRDMGLFLMGEVMDAKPEAYMQMSQEAQVEKKEADPEDGQAGDAQNKESQGEEHG